MALSICDNLVPNATNVLRDYGVWKRLVVLGKLSPFEYTLQVSSIFRPASIRHKL